MQAAEPRRKSYRFVLLIWTIFVGLLAGFLLTHAQDHSGGAAVALEEVYIQSNSDYEAAITSIEERQVQDDLANAKRAIMARHDAQKAIRTSLENWGRIVDASSHPTRQINEAQEIKNP